jgi:uncharacterized protein YndB with AHSA1/START domain
MGGRYAVRCGSAAALLSLVGVYGSATMAETPPRETRDGDVATVVRDFDLAPELLWKAWTEPEYMSRWFGSDPNGRVLEAHADARVGGRFSVTFVDSDGTQHTASGEYLEVAPLSRLVFTWQWRSEPGHSSTVSVSLIPKGSGVTMRFEHAGIGYGSSHNYEHGWRQTFDKLERAFGG